MNDLSEVQKQELMHKPRKFCLSWDQIHEACQGVMPLYTAGLENFLMTPSKVAIIEQ